MANTVNLGSVIGPKPGLTPVSVRKKITDKDAKGRYYINVTSLVTGLQYLEITLSAAKQSPEILLYLPGTDGVAGKLNQIYEVPGHGGVLLRTILPSPFTYCISADNIAEIWLTEEGKTWS